MKIILQNHNEKYAVQEIVNEYFPKIKLCFSSSILENENYIFSEYSHTKNSHIYYAKCSVDGINAEHSVSSDEYNKTNLKKCISACLSDITGIHLPWGVLTGIRPSKIVREYVSCGKTYENAYELLNGFYEADESKCRLAVNVEKNESNLIKNMYDDGISLYIGIPFCPTRCLYCSFTSQSIHFSNKLTQPYVEALKKEINEVSKLEYIRKRRIETVYFGGGTPSALTGEQIEDILSSLFHNFDLSNVKEITFEAGRPDTITRDKLEVLKKFNISRISINPQTSNDKTLEIIGRKHTYSDFEDSLALARDLGFSHINCDIIAGLPDETEMDFQKTLDSLILHNPESITVHTMSIKHGSFLDMRYDMYSLSTAKTVDNMLNSAFKTISATGMIPYYMYRQKNMIGNLENIGYCKPGHECLYNIYIMEEVQSIIALGAGGSAKIVSDESIERVFNVKEVSEYINRIDEMIERKRNLLDLYI